MNSFQVVSYLHSCQETRFEQERLCGLLLYSLQVPNHRLLCGISPPYLYFASNTLEEWSNDIPPQLSQKTLRIPALVSAHSPSTISHSPDLPEGVIQIHASSEMTVPFALRRWLISATNASPVLTSNDGISEAAQCHSLFWSMNRGWVLHCQNINIESTRKKLMVRLRYPALRLNSCVEPHRDACTRCTRPV